MYSLLIVDDERIIREGIRKYIEKRCDNVTVDATFDDGAQVIRYLENNSADIIITDICMDDVSGLQLAKYVSQAHPQIKMIIISGYKKFEYAREAMEYSVVDYLLKPVSNADILAAVHSAIEKIEKDRELCKKIDLYDEMIGDLRSKFFLDLTIGVIGSSADIHAEFEKLKFDFGCDDVYAYICKIEYPFGFFERYTYGRDGAENVINNFFATNRRVLYETDIGNDMRVIILPENSFDAVATEFAEWVEAAFGENIVFKPVFHDKGIESLHNYSVENVRHYEDIDDSIKVQIFKLMNSYLNLGMVDNADKLFSQLRSGLNETNLRELVKFLYENSCFELKTDFNAACAQGDVVSAFNSLCTSVNSFNENDDVLIKKIKDYINKNYSKDITLESVANKVYLHSVYVSRYFKSHTGQNFSDYLFNVRMTHAIDLLKTDKYKIGQVGEMVGYRNYKYFSKQFKNYTGYTPKKYFREVWFVNVDDE